MALTDDRVPDDPEEHALDALEELFQRYHRPLVAFFLHKGFSTEESRDLAQETFFRVYKNRERFRGEKCIRAVAVQIDDIACDAIYALTQLIAYDLASRIDSDRSQVVVYDLLAVVGEVSTTDERSCHLVLLPFEVGSLGPGGPTVLGPAESCAPWPCAPTAL